MLRILLPPLLAILLGGAGNALRSWELSTAFEGSGLAIPGTPASLCLIALSIAAAVVLALLSPRGKTGPHSYADHFSARGNWAYPVICTLSSAALLAAAVVGMKQELMSFSPGKLRVLLWLMCILSAGCVVYIGRKNFLGQGGKYSLPLLAPAYTCCLWLIAAYQTWAAEPVILAFVYQLFAVIFPMLAIYFMAGFSFGSGRLWCCTVTSLLGIYFSFVTLADSHSLPAQLLHMFSIMYLLANVVVLLRRVYPVNQKKTSGGHLV